MKSPTRSCRLLRPGSAWTVQTAGKGEITVTVKRGLRLGTLLNGISGKEHSKELDKFWG